VRWPRAGQAEWDAIHAAFASDPWRAVRLEERAHYVTRLVACLEEEPDPLDVVRRAWGFSSAEFEQHMAGLSPALRSSGRAQMDVEAGGPMFVQFSWRAAFFGLVPWLIARLASGHACVLLSDPLLPGVADALGAAAARAGLPAGALAVVHDDGQTFLRHAWSRCDWPLAALMPSAALEGLRSIAGSDEAFGQGIFPVESSRALLEPVRRATRVVGPEEDPERVAEDVVEEAFGRVSQLSGQAHGALGHVYCAPGSFARLSQRVLALLERGAAGPPVPLLDPTDARKLNDIKDLGLDEGATLIVDGASNSSPFGAGKASLRGLVFTNVESTMRLVDVDEPLPWLCLARDGGSGA